MQTREIPAAVKAKVPVTAIYGAIKEQNAQRAVQQSQQEKAQAASEAVLCKTALAVFRFRGHLDALTDTQRGAFAAVENALSEGGLEIVDYTGMPVDDFLLAQAKIEGWEDGSQPVDLVKECFSPEIRWHGKILHTAQLFCARANPGAALPPVAEEEAAAPADEPVPPAPGPAEDAAPAAEPSKKTGWWQRLKNYLTGKKNSD